MAVQDLTQVQPDTTQDGEAQSLPRNMQINRDRYDVRIKTCGFKVSAKGNKMLELEIEIYNPDTIKHAATGLQYSVAGMSCRKYVMMQTNNDLLALAEFMKRLGLTPAIDAENPETEQFVGKCFSDIISPATYEKRKTPTAEQLQADPKAQGDVIVDPETGKPEVSYGIQTGFGTSDVRKATKTANAGF